MINLKVSNVYVVATHFKMESIRSVKGLIQKWADQVRFKRCLLDGNSAPLPSEVSQILLARPVVVMCGPTVKTKQCFHYIHKLMKPVVATLRKLGIRVILYLDDMLIMANSRDKARDHCQCAIYLLTSLGFILNVE